MIEKNFVNDINVLISNSFIKSTCNEFTKHNNNISNKNIEDKIKELLIREEKIHSDTKIHFRKINDKFQGIIIDDQNQKEIICFTQLLDQQNKPKSRNTFLSQNLQPIYNIADKYKIKNKSVSLNPFDISKKPKLPNFIKITLRQLITIGGWKLNNNIVKLDDFTPFHTLKEFIETKTDIRKKNKGNDSTSIQWNDDKTITIYGRLDGANFSDTIETCKIIHHFLKTDNVKIYFYDISPFNSHSKLKKVKNQLWDMNIEIGSTKITSKKYLEKNFQKDIDIKQLLPRDQDLFKSNIIKKYIKNKIDISKCFASSYEISENLIASHIHRVADIRNEFLNGKIDYKEAAHLLISGDNGFLLSPNKDKEFEKGQIYFDTKNKKFCPNKLMLNEQQYNNLFKSLQSQLDLSKLNMSDEFIKNNIKHQKRIELLK